jgi:hypothetical protein
MAAEHKDGNPVDPFEAFRGMRDSYLDAMSKVMINAVNSEEYAQATGAMLNSSLMASAPFREALDKAMEAAMQHASMPSRQEVAALAGRFTNIEMRLDDMEAKLDRIIQLCSVAKPVPTGSGSHENVKPKGKSPQRRSPAKG